MPRGAEHGGAFWDALGADFHHLENWNSIINADVLDAWFPPSPAVLNALKEPAEWMYQTSPPTDAEGMLAAISQARNVDESQIVLGAGSSDIIFRSFLMDFGPGSRALVPDPTYGEYAHVLGNVVGAKVDRLPLRDWQVDLDRAAERLNSEHYDLFVLVNPNSPTGHSLPPAAISDFLARIPASTQVWIDEAYADYVGETCEGLVAPEGNVVVCKSMSKVYSLSGVRAGYAVGPTGWVERTRLRTPPWIVSLPGQIAACAALEDQAYYHARFEENRVLRAELALALSDFGGYVLEGKANFALWFLPDHLSARIVASRCIEAGLYLREAASIGTGLENALRVSVKARDVQARMLEILADVVRS